MNEILQNLFDKLKEILHTEEFGYHSIKNGRLMPVYKNDTEGINLEKWQKYHSENPVIIENDIVLTEVIKTQKSISIDNTNSNSNYAACYKAFGINSIYVVPMIKHSNVVGVVVMPVMQGYYTFSEKIKEQCEVIIKEYNKLLIDENFL